MKRFLAVFTINVEKMAAFQQSADVQQRSQEGVAAWHQWMADHAAVVVDAGGPLSRTLAVSAAGIADARNNLGGYLVVQAESQAAAAQLFVNHPSFAIFPGEGVEVMEILPIPGK
ncbi:MAG: hypothetical protein JOY60_17980 [Burkholderiaceae bacterium]|nr:hypothetical protein [Roseateles sp.]MBV8471740.1 hypothetical protein [Burkholderiaceae bacterium]